MTEEKKYTANVVIKQWFKVTVEADNPEEAEEIIAHLDYENPDQNPYAVVIDDGGEFEVYDVEEATVAESNTKKKTYTVTMTPEYEEQLRRAYGDGGA